MSSFTLFASGETTNIGESSHTIHNGNLYISDETSSIISRVNLSNASVTRPWVTLPEPGSRVIVSDDNYLYVCKLNRIIRVNINTPTDISSSWVVFNPALTNYTGGATYYNGNIFFSTTAGSRIMRINTINATYSLFANTTASYTGVGYYQGNIYYPHFNTVGLYQKSITSTDPTTPGKVIYSPGLYICGMVFGNNYVLTAEYSTTNFNLINLTDGTLQTAYTSTLVGSGKYAISDYQGNVYVVRASTSNVYIAPTPSLLIPPPPPPPPPSNSVSINAANTTVVASGNLRVSIVDPSNTLANGIYYEYSVNGNGYVNTGVFAGTSPNTLYVLSSDISNTVLIRAKNVSGNSTPISVPSNLSIIYQRPRAPPTPTFTIVGSGNVQVSINESTTTPAPYYYLNNVSYHLYAYNTFGGTNLSGNTSTLVYNQPVGVLSNTNSTYSSVVSYVNTGLNANTYTMYVIARNNFGNSTPVFANVSVYTSSITNISFDTGNTSIVAAGNLKVTINDLNNNPRNGIYYFYSVNAGATYANSNVPNNVSGKTSYTFFIPYNATDIQTIYVRAQNPFGNSNIVGVNIYSPFNNALYTTTNRFFIDNSTNYNFVATGFSNKTYSVYLKSKNAIGYSANSVPNSVTVYLSPIASVQFDAGNTRTVASGNLQVRITDLSNTSLNGVYYQYAINNNVDASFANTFVRANVSPYTFFIPSITDISNTIYVRASNPVGNSSPSANLQVIVYQTPTVPGQVQFQLVGSANVQVTITETSPIPYYYLNNVSYYLYAYNTFGGTNLSGNTSLLVYNRPVGILSNTNSTYNSVVSYVNTGLNANTYTMYVISRNDFGNSVPFSANIVVYTTPIVPTIDTGNTKSTTSGNLTVSLLDASNSANNGLYYLYSTDGITYGNSGVAPNGNTSYKFTINNTGNALVPLVANTYSLYIKVSNPVGNVTTAPSTVYVYTTPFVPTIDTGNTKSATSGNLTVSLLDASNSATNGLYYLYSTDGITYGNSRVAPIGNGNTSYTFTINNTGNALIPLVANTYSLYIRVSNPVGNATTAPFIVNVYTTPAFPPKFDTGNTISATSGNITVAFTDPSNNPMNAISYWYYVLDPSGTNNSGNLAYYSNTNLTLTTGAQQSFSVNGAGYINKTYTVYLRSVNSVGVSTASFANVLVYTVPTDIYLDTANIQTVATGNLRVSLVDPSNGTNNGVYYQYSVIGVNGNAYTNANAQGIGSSNIYQFYINVANPDNYTINVVAKNTVGTSNTNTFTTKVYTLPNAPLIDQPNTLSKTSGNLSVSFNDTTNVAINEVRYSYYLHDYDPTIQFYYV